MTIPPIFNHLLTKSNDAHYITALANYKDKIPLDVQKILNQSKTITNLRPLQGAASLENMLSHFNKPLTTTSNHELSIHYAMNILDSISIPVALKAAIGGKLLALLPELHTQKVKAQKDRDILTDYIANMSSEELVTGDETNTTEDPDEVKGLVRKVIEKEIETKETEVKSLEQNIKSIEDLRPLIDQYIKLADKEKTHDKTREKPVERRGEIAKIQTKLAALPKERKLKLEDLKKLGFISAKVNEKQAKNELEKDEICQKIMNRNIEIKQEEIEYFIEKCEIINKSLT